MAEAMDPRFDRFGVLRPRHAQTGSDDLPGDRVRPPPNHCLLDIAHFQQYVLDFGRIDLLLADIDQIAGPPQYPDVATIGQTISDQAIDCPHLVGLVDQIAINPQAQPEQVSADAGVLL